MSPYLARFVLPGLHQLERNRLQLVRQWIEAAFNLPLEESLLKRYLCQNHLSCICKVKGSKFNLWGWKILRSTFNCVGQSRPSPQLAWAKMRMFCLRSQFWQMLFTINPAPPGQPLLETKRGELVDSTMSLTLNFLETGDTGRGWDRYCDAILKFLKIAKFLTGRHLTEI